MKLIYTDIYEKGDAMAVNKRRLTPSVDIGGILMGSDHPVRVQSMTNTVTARADQTIAQIKELADAGSEYVRITVNDASAAQAVPSIVAQLRDAATIRPSLVIFIIMGTYC